MNKQVKTKTISVSGMHCASCDLLVKKQFKTFPNITTVTPDYKNETVEVSYTNELSIEELNAVICDFGYKVTELKDSTKEIYSEKLLKTIVIAVVFGVVIFIAQGSGLGVNFGGFALTSLGSVFILGLIASVSTCMATSGALFIATISKLQRKGSFINKAVPALSFMIGRVASYAFFGLIFGFLGKSITALGVFGNSFNILIAIFLLIIGIDMAGLLPWSLGLPNGTKHLYSKLEGILSKHGKSASFFLGAISYLLPCGFTATTQAYALALASPTLSALTMAVFALGTLPAIIGVSFLTQFKKFSFYNYAMRIVAVVIIFFGVSYLSNALNLYGITINPFTQAKVVEAAPVAPVVDGKQVVTMNVTSQGYQPNMFTVRAGIPVEWKIIGEQIYGCQGSLVAPQADIPQLTIKEGEQVAEFTPRKKGTISFSCTMGMYGGVFKVI